MKCRVVDHEDGIAFKYPSKWAEGLNIKAGDTVFVDILGIVGDD